MDKTVFQYSLPTPLSFVVAQTNPVAVASTRTALRENAVSKSVKARYSTAPFLLLWMGPVDPDAPELV
ncbi:MAG: hypothetical protein M3Y54_07810 [Bacteroidota bacterium]|nr:hypothetical protein [Bacteroidota bacterium]